MAVSSKLPERIRQGVVAHITRYDLLRRQEFRDSFLSRVPSQKLKKLAGNRTRTLWEVIVAGAEAHLNNRPSYTSDFYLATGFSRTTVGRCLNILEKLEIIRQKTDESDRRRTIVEFCTPFLELLDQYVDDCFEEFEELITNHHDQERIRAELALHDSEARYRSLVEVAADAIIVVTDDEIVFANSAAQKMFRGFSPDQLVGQHIDKIVHPDFREGAARRRKQMLLTHSASPTVEKTALKLDGSEFYVEASAGYIKWQGKDSVQPIIRDISRRKAGEKALRESESRFRDLVDGSIQGVLIHRDHKPLYVNKAFADIHGYRTQELLRLKSNLSLVAPEERTRIAGLAKRRLAKEDVPSHYEYKAAKKNGEYIWLDNLARVVEWNGQMAIQSTVVDITERKRLEHELGQAHMLEALGELTGGVAHKFNNLLAVIMGNVELLDDLDELVDKQQRKSIEGILRASQKGAEIVRRLQSYAQQQRLNPRAVDITELALVSGERLKSILDETVRVDLRLRGDPLMCRVDKDQLKVALNILVDNALEAMPNGGELTLETGEETVSEGEKSGNGNISPGDYVSLSVRDTGTGIEPEHLDRIFEPFFTTKEISRHHGLGLSMVYGFVNQSGGFVNIESEKDVGTSLHLYLPKLDQLED